MSASTCFHSLAVQRMAGIIKRNKGSQSPMVCGEGVAHWMPSGIHTCARCLESGLGDNVNTIASLQKR